MKSQFPKGFFILAVGILVLFMIAGLAFQSKAIDKKQARHNKEVCLKSQNEQQSKTFCKPYNKRALQRKYKQSKR